MKTDALLSLVALQGAIEWREKWKVQTKPIGRDLCRRIMRKCALRMRRMDGKPSSYD